MNQANAYRSEMAAARRHFDSRKRQLARRHDPNSDLIQRAKCASNDPAVPSNQ
jgi:hypothetical protein